MLSLARRWILIGALIGAIGVGLGAFGAHGLPGFLDRLGYRGDDLARRLDIFETACRYQMFHALALVLTGLALSSRESNAWRLAAWAFFAGVLIFSGLLIVLAFAGPRWNWLGMIVPAGGVAMIVGWIALAIGALKEP
ncbi:MAG: DUF423 domain-containing protein [Planctomycetes bacterium]|nr:DUF423 domain-containing protein [Planctomycetota bacterium]